MQTGNLLFLTGMLPTEGRSAKFVGRFGAELNVEEARAAARLAAINGLAVARDYLGSLDKVTRVVRLASQWRLREMFATTRRSLTPHRSCCRTLFGREKNPSRLVYGVASLPLGTPVELEIIFEVAG